MKQHTVRLAALAEITSRSRDIIRSMQNKKETPWDDEEFEQGQQRRYSGYHAISLVLAEILAAQGCTAAEAAEFVRNHKLPITLFLDEVENSAAATSRFVLAMKIGVEDEWAGFQWQSYTLMGAGTEEEVSNAISRAISGVGRVRETRKGRTSERIVCGPWVAIASIPEAYRILRKRAENAGFLIDGRRIGRLASVEDEAEDAD